MSDVITTNLGSLSAAVPGYPVKSKSAGAHTLLVTLTGLGAIAYTGMLMGSNNGTDWTPVAPLACSGVNTASTPLQVPGDYAFWRHDVVTLSGGPVVSATMSTDPASAASGTTVAVLVDPVTKLPRLGGNSGLTGAALSRATRFSTGTRRQRASRLNAGSANQAPLRAANTPFVPNYNARLRPTFCRFSNGALMIAVAVTAGAVTASLAGNTMTITAVTSGKVGVDQWVSFSDGSITRFAKITALGTSTGGTGTVTVEHVPASYNPTLTGRAVAVGGWTGTGSEPDFSDTAFVSDGDVTWAYYGKRSRQAPGAPSVTVTSTDTKKSGYVEYTVLANPDKFLQVSAPNVLQYQTTGASQAWSFINGSAGAGAITGGPAGNDVKNRVVSFITDDPSPQPMFSATGSHRSFRSRVDDILIEENPKHLLPLPGTVAYLTHDLGSRAFRRYVYEMGGDHPFRGVAIGPMSRIFAAPMDGCVLEFFSDSTGGTVAGPTAAAQEWPVQLGRAEQLARELGYDHCLNRFVGSTGYVNTGSAAGAPFYSAEGVVRNNLPAVSVDAAIFDYGYNDLTLFQAEPQTFIAAAKAAWMAWRQTRGPDPALLVGEHYPGRSNPSASGSGVSLASYQMGLALRDAVASMNDPRCRFVQRVTRPEGPAINGTGSTIAPAGDGNADFVVGGDGAHKSPMGTGYLVGFDASAYDAALADMGV